MHQTRVIAFSDGSDMIAAAACSCGDLVSLERHGDSAKDVAELDAKAHLEVFADADDDGDTDESATPYPEDNSMDSDDNITPSIGDGTSDSGSEDSSDYSDSADTNEDDDDDMSTYTSVWKQVGSSFKAFSEEVYTIERCPLCIEAVRTDPNKYGQIVCDAGHGFSFDDNGSYVTLGYVGNYAKKSDFKVAMTEPAAVIDFERDASANCPLCAGTLLFNRVEAIRLGSFDNTSIDCTRGHEFASYLRNGKDLYLFPLTIMDTPQVGI